MWSIIIHFPELRLRTVHVIYIGHLATGDMIFVCVYVMSNPRLVSQRSRVWFPPWSGKLFSLPGVDATQSQSNITNIVFTWVHNINTHKNRHILEYIDIGGTRLSSAKYHQLDLVALSVGRALDWYPKGRGFDSHRGQANFSACPVWMHTQSNITNNWTGDIFGMMLISKMEGN